MLCTTIIAVFLNITTALPRLSSQSQPIFTIITPCHSEFEASDTASIYLGGGLERNDPIQDAVKIGQIKSSCVISEEPDHSVEEFKRRWKKRTLVSR